MPYDVIRKLDLGSMNGAVLLIYLQLFRCFERSFYFRDFKLSMFVIMFRLLRFCYHVHQGGP